MQSEIVLDGLKLSIEISAAAVAFISIVIILIWVIMKGRKLVVKLQSFRMVRKVIAKGRRLRLFILSLKGFEFRTGK